MTPHIKSVTEDVSLRFLIFCVLLFLNTVSSLPALLYAERSRGFKTERQRKLEPKKWDSSSINTHFKYFPRGPLEDTRYQHKAQEGTGLTSGKMLILN